MFSRMDMSGTINWSAWCAFFSKVHFMNDHTIIALTSHRWNFLICFPSSEMNFKSRASDSCSVGRSTLQVTYNLTRLLKTTLVTFSKKTLAQVIRNWRGWKNPSSNFNHNTPCSHVLTSNKIFSTKGKVQDLLRRILGFNKTQRIVDCTQCRSWIL